MTDTTDTYYNYDLIPKDERKGKYCQAPRHGATRVTASYLETFKAPALGIENMTTVFSCEDCHDSMMLAFMEASLPEATEDELRQAEADADIIE